MMPAGIPTQGTMKSSRRPSTMRPMAANNMPRRFPPRRGRNLELKHDHALVGELAHGVRRAFARVARVLDAAVRHLVGPERGRLVDDDAAELQLARSAHRR